MIGVITDNGLISRGDGKKYWISGGESELDRGSSDAPRECLTINQGATPAVHIALDCSFDWFDRVDISMLHKQYFFSNMKTDNIGEAQITVYENNSCNVANCTLNPAIKY